MEPDGQTYLLPHPVFARVLMTAGGLFALVTPPWELGRALWPVNLFTPFVAIIVLGGMSVGAGFVYGGLFAPARQMRFLPGMIEVIQTFLWGRSRTVIRMEDIDGFDVEESQNSDGPNDWYAVIRLKGRRPLGSRPLATKQAAERQLEEFRRLLGA
jgi:hypothetical protein